jgi:hypothetical protein
LGQSVPISLLLGSWQKSQANPALNPAPFGRWTLRDKAAQRRLALRWPSGLGIRPGSSPQLRCSYTVA